MSEHVAYSGVTQLDQVLSEQIEYYKARAAEYDEWWLRTGRYHRSEEETARWNHEKAELEAAVKKLGLNGRVLEIGSGTGIWTKFLLEAGCVVTAVDASPEMHAINQAKNADRAHQLHCIEADAFNLPATLPTDFDASFSSFFFSHIPPSNLHGFLVQLGRHLAWGSTVCVIDSVRTESSTAANHRLPDDLEAVTLERKLNDGRSFQIYKVFYESAELDTAMIAAGFQPLTPSPEIHKGEFFFARVYKKAS